jgi:hypothetical protein
LAVKNHLLSSSSVQEKVVSGTVDTLYKYYTCVQYSLAKGIRLLATFTNVSEGAGYLIRGLQLLPEGTKPL